MEVCSILQFQELWIWKTTNHKMTCLVFGEVAQELDLSHGGWTWGSLSPDGQGKSLNHTEPRMIIAK